MATGDQHSRVPLAVASAATFLAYLDVTVVNVAFPDLSADFAGASLTELSWVVSAYALAFAALLAPAGRIADRLGRRRIFVSGLAGFAAGSLLALLAPSVGWLIAARVAQGAGAAAMVPAALGLVLATAPPERRMAAIGAWGAAGSLAAAAGPTLGGLLVEGFGWRAVFAINLPLAGLAIAAAMRGVPVLAGDGSRRPDLAGTGLVVLALGLLVGGLTQSGPWGLGDWRTLALIGLGAGMLSAALLRAAHHPAPAINVELFGDRSFAAAAAGGFAGAALFAWLLFGVLFLTEVWSYSVLTAGLAVSPGALTSIVASVLAGRMASSGKVAAAVSLGGAAMALAGVALAVLVTETPAYLTLWLPIGLLSGLGFGLLLTGAAAAAAGVLPPARFAAGTGLVLTARQVGGGIGIATGAAILAGSTDLASFSLVFGLCGAAAAAAAAAGLALGRSLRPLAAPVSPTEILRAESGA